MSKIELEEGQTLTAHDINGIYRAIKAEIRGAEDKRGEEVLELALKEIEDEITDNLVSPFDNVLKRINLVIRQAYKERYEQG